MKLHPIETNRKFITREFKVQKTYTHKHNFLGTQKLMDRAKSNEFNRIECAHTKSTSANTPTNTSNQITNFQSSSPQIKPLKLKQLYI